MKMPIRESSSGKLRHRWRVAQTKLLAISSVLAVALLVTSSSSAASAASSSEFGPSAYKGPLPTAAELDKTIQQAIYVQKPASELPPQMAQALQVVAAQHLTQSQQDLIVKCIKNNGCDTGGTGNITVAILDSVPNIALAQFNSEGIAQMLAYPQIKTIVIRSGTGDLQSYLAAFNELIVEKPTILMLNNIFGEAAAPAFKKATKAGILVYESAQPVPGAKPGVDYQSLIQYGQCQEWIGATQMAVKQVQSPKVAAIMTGIAGSPFANSWQPCTKKVLKNAGWTIGFDGTTNYTPQGETQAANALLATGKQMGAVFYESSSDAIVQAYLTAGQTPPLMVSPGGQYTSSYSLWQKQQGTSHAFDEYAGSGEAWIYRVTVTTAMNHAVLKIKQPAVITVPRFAVPIQDTVSFVNLNVPPATFINSLLPSSLLFALQK